MAAGDPLLPLVPNDQIAVAVKKSATPAALAEALGHRFLRPALLTEALTHRSAVSAKQPDCFGYERLEFLGDRVLGLIIANLLLQHFPAESEGQLARRFNALVQGETLATVAQSVGLGDYLILAPSEAQAGGRSNRSLLADVCEAVIAALFLDGGMAAAERFVESHWLPLLMAKARPRRDAKTRLQEWAQSRGLPLPLYEIVGREGPAHDPKFVLRVSLDGVGSADGQGGSKRVAEQQAAGALMTHIGLQEKFK